jgi:ApbE superfamily uncharacterized protein (UPF0280 family)
LKEARVRIKETDILLKSDTRRALEEGKKSVIRARADLECYVAIHPEFLFSLEPVKCEKNAPEVVKLMAWAGEKAGVGPMAAVAGAVAELVTRDMMGHGSFAVAENGGDISLRGKRESNVLVYAGEKGVSGVGIKLEEGDMPAGLCTSSGTVGHSISFGCADAATVLCKSAALSDAYATALGNSVKKESSLSEVVENNLRKDVMGILIVRKNEVAFSAGFEKKLLFFENAKEKLRLL